MRYACARFFVFAFLFAPLLAHAQTPAERAALQSQLDQITKEIEQNQVNLAAAQQARTSLERDVAILDYKIQQAQLQIKQTDLRLKQLGNDIAARQADIRSVDKQVAAGQESLAQILRRTREMDDVSFAQRALEGSFSDLFRELDDFGTVQRALGESFTEMAVLRDDLSVRKAALEDKQLEVQQVRTAQVIAKEQIQNDEKKKQALLKVTKGQEALYQELIAGKQQQAAAIRAQLFGLRDSTAIQFGTAYQYAKEASASTGVAPALILAILTQESNLGQNTGSCYVSNLSTGSGKRKDGSRSYPNVMKAPRDTVPFETITRALGREWATTAVSCPQSIGYGGAMGPAQFIPSTWMLYKDRLARLTGETMPDPWNPRTAVFATALYMADIGADRGTRAAERTAACRYFSGRSCSGSIAIYGNSVMDLRDDIQSQIDVLAGGV